MQLYGSTIRIVQTRVKQAPTTLVVVLAFIGYVWYTVLGVKNIHELGGIEYGTI